MTKLNAYEIANLIDNLVGNIIPIGDEAHDNDAYENMWTLTTFLKEFNYRIEDIATLKSDYNSSKKVVELANKYLVETGIKN